MYLVFVSLLLVLEVKGFPLLDKSSSKIDEKQASPTNKLTDILDVNSYQHFAYFESELLQVTLTKNNVAVLSTYLASFAPNPPTQKEVKASHHLDFMLFF